MFQADNHIAVVAGTPRTKTGYCFNTGNLQSRLVASISRRYTFLRSPLGAPMQHTCRSLTFCTVDDASSDYLPRTPGSKSSMVIAPWPLAESGLVAESVLVALSLERRLA